MLSNGVFLTPSITEPVAPFSDFGKKRISDLMRRMAFFACLSTKSNDVHK